MATILIVDDNEEIRLFLRTVLRVEHRIIEASNGSDAMVLFYHHKPDLIITDLNMPFMSGLELVQAIRASGSKIRIIVASARFHDVTERIQLLEAGADLCVEKPVELAVLKKAVAAELSASSVIARDCRSLLGKSNSLYPD
jgi:DNA-binding response OmpR family regulator